MRRGIAQWIDDLQLLDHRAGPSVRDDERQCIFMFRTNVNEMNVQPINLGHEVRQGLQFRLAFAPIVISPPIAGEFLSLLPSVELRGLTGRLVSRTSVMEGSFLNERASHSPELIGRRAL